MHDELLNFNTLGSYARNLCALYSVLSKNYDQNMKIDYLHNSIGKNTTNMLNVIMDTEYQYSMKLLE